MTPILCPTLLGRDEERERLTAALTAAGSDCGSATLVLGDAGMGKSRLVSELRGLALDQGFTVLVGRAVQAETPIPFRPLAEGLLGAFRATGPPSLASLQPVHGALGRLVPEWREDDTGVGDVSLVLVAEAMLRVLRVLARSRGCLLILEDIHWADPETLAVLEYLADNVSSERVLCRRRLCCWLAHSPLAGWRRSSSSLVSVGPTSSGWPRRVWAAPLFPVT
jgi:predicted ATPase